MEVENRYSAWTIYRRMVGEARPYWPQVAAVFALNLLATPLKLLLPLPLKIAVDSVVGNAPPPSVLGGGSGPLGTWNSESLLIFACIGYIGLTVIAYGNGLLIWGLHTFAAEKLLLRFRAKLLRRLQELPFAYHDRKGSSDSTYRIQYDAQSIQWVVFDGIQPFLTSAVTIIALLGVTAALSWQIALIAVIVAPLLLLLTRSWGARLRRQWRHAKRLQSSAMAVVQESLSSLRIIKTFSAEDREQERFVNRGSDSVQGQMQVALSQGLFDLCSGTLLGTATAAALYVGIRQVQSGAMSLGDFLLVWAYLAQLMGPLETIGKKVSTLQGAFASADRALSILDESPMVTESPNAVAVERARGAVRFDQVTFGYEPSQATLSRVSLDVEAGECLGVVGPTGAGKTTIATLLLRFYDPASGSVTLDGVDLRDLRLEDLRQQFSVVLQDSVLFSTSIAENIAYGRPNATREEIVSAAKAAEAHGFIEASPSGYETQVGEGGMMLSGGERQRIAIARAFLLDTPMLILDEPTSALDAKTEEAIGGAIARLAAGRTTFLITHRTGILSICDRIVRVEAGKLSDAKEFGASPPVSTA